jgi:hypothetical protein
MLLDYGGQGCRFPVRCRTNPANITSVATTPMRAQQIFDTIGANLEYSFFERQSAVAIYEMYQNMLIPGISKRV